MKVVTYLICFIFCFLFCAKQIHAQPYSTIQLDNKPKKYQKRTLASEKTGQKKFTGGRHFYQNMVTHFNYYFNANNKLNDVLDRAKFSFKDDYTALLPFYNFSLDNTARDGDIDTIIYKCTAGILLHDLRNDWIDNMYLLLGEAYYYRKNFDSASMVFRYINYAFAPKDDGYDIPVGSNSSNTNGIFTVATNEDRNFWKKVSTHLPSRNEALLWQAKNLIETKRNDEASGLLEILRHDPQFPERLQSPLHEVLAYNFYNMHIYDSAAFFLSKALDVTVNRQEKSRREFLIAQLYLLAGDNDLAIAWYNKCAEQTLDPVMEVYADLNSIAAYSDDNSAAAIQQKINNLIKLAKKDKYILNRDIIYYAIAQLELKANDTVATKSYLKKSIAATVNNQQQKSKSFLMMADFDYDQGHFVDAKNEYDSTVINNILNADDKARIASRKPPLKTIKDNLDIIHREDSLQHIAQLPEAERNALIKKIVAKQRKQEGLNDEDAMNINPAVQANNKTAPDLFAASNNSSSSDWYFNNATAKASGANAFRLAWGNRPNVDNWRRQAAVQQALSASRIRNMKIDSSTTQNAGTGETNFKNLLKNVPLTEQAMIASNGRISKALFSNGKVFINDLEHYPAAIRSLEKLTLHYPDSTLSEEAMFDLYYCYIKTNRQASADSIKQLLDKNYPKGLFTAKLNNRAPVIKTESDTTKKYEAIYNLFIEGDFEKAKTEKAIADSMYGNNHWSPQLLFIESIYYVSKRQDSAAINRLNKIVVLYPSTPLASRAKTMIDVLKRRTEIENYLKALEITRATDETAPVINLTPVETTIENRTIVIDSLTQKKAGGKIGLITDTARAKPVIINSFAFNAKDSQYVAILLDKVDVVFVNETQNAFNMYNRQNLYNQKINLNKIKIDDRYSIVLAGPFEDAAKAIEYVDKTKPIAGSRIIPWLKADKYSYLIISQSNLTLLQNNKDVDSYKKMLQQSVPNKF